MRIMVPFETADFSESAIPAATRLARALDEELLLVTVSNPRIDSAMQDFAAVEGEDPIDIVESRLRGMAQLVTDVEVGIDMLDGDDPVASIIARADRDDIDTIVIAGQRRTGVQRWITPSVAERVVRGSTVPVMVVPARESARQVEEDSAGRRRLGRSKKRGEGTMKSDTLQRSLTERGISFEESAHPKTYTAQALAEAAHLSGNQVAKPVFLMADGELVMAVVPAAFELDLDKARYALGTEDVRLAKEAEFDPVFPDCDAGAEPAVGTLYGVPTVADTRLTAETILFDGGSHTEAITMRLSDYLDLVHPKRADLAMSGPE